MGRIAVGAPADLIALPAAGDPADTLLAAQPSTLALVMVGGGCAWRPVASPGRAIWRRSGWAGSGSTFSAASRP